MRKEAPIAFVPQLGSTVFTRRDDIFTQEKRIDVFSSHQPAGLMNVLMGHNMMRKDGDAHMAERAAMFPAVSPRTVRDTWVRQFQAHADRILDELAPQGAADLCKAFALPLSAECLKDITGLTNMRFQDMDAWSQAMIDGIANYTGNKEVEARCHAATAGIDAAIDDMIPVVTKHPEHLDPQRAAGRRPDRCESIRANIKLAISGGQNEPRDAICRHDLGAADASRTARAGARRQARSGSTCSRNMRAGSRRSACRRAASQNPGRSAASISSRRIACSSCSARPIATRPASAIPIVSTSPAIPRRASPSAPARITAPAPLPPAPWSPTSRCPSMFARLKGLRLDEREPVRIGGWAFRGLLNLPVKWDADA